MNNTKKVILVLGVIVVVLGLIVLFTRRRPASVGPNAPSVVSPTLKMILSPSPPVSTSNIQSMTNQMFEIISRLSRQDTNIPETLPRYTVRLSPMSSEQTASIGRGLGFTSEPVLYTGGQYGETYVWRSAETGRLRVVPTLWLIDFISSAEIDITQAVLPNDETLTKKAQTFLTEKRLIDPSLIRFSEVRFLLATEETSRSTSRNDANRVEVLFNENINGYNVVNQMPGAGTISVGMNRRGDIVSAIVDRTGQLDVIDQLPLKTFTELELSLPRTKLQLLDGQAFDAVQRAPEVVIKRITVESARVAYLQESNPTQQLLQPIFSLEGTATLDDGLTVPALLYLPALKGQ